MNLTKSREYFDPGKLKEPIHIIGCGAVGSTLAELLARLGIKNIHLWDFDTVEPKNIANQMFFAHQIGKPKTEAVAQNIEAIQENARNIRLHKKGWREELLQGHIFLCVDSIETRKDVLEKNMYNQEVKTVTDFRMGLEDGQIYFTEWNTLDNKKNLLATMDFTHEEAKANVPVSACGVELGVAPTVRMVVNAGAANFINHHRKKETHKQIIVNAFTHNIIAV
jgi:ketopantoate reductase